MKIYSFLAVLFCVSFFSCKKVETKGNEEPTDNTKEVVIPVVKIDTSYKNNIRLFDEYYYNMPSESVAQVKNESIAKNNSKEVVLTYNKRPIFLEKEFFYKDNLLKSIQLKGDSKDGSSVLSLFKEKYGEPKVIEENEKSIHIENLVTKVLEIKNNYRGGYETVYNPSIHKEISDKEFQKYYNDLQMNFLKVANEKLHIIDHGPSGFFKIMKDITEDEFVSIGVEVAIKKNKYTEINTIAYCTWNDGKKQILLKFIKSTNFIGNQLPQVSKSFNNLIIKFSSLEDKVIVPKQEKKIDSSKELEEKSLNAI